MTANASTSSNLMSAAFQRLNQFRTEIDTALGRGDRHRANAILDQANKEHPGFAEYYKALASKPAPDRTADITAQYREGVDAAEYGADAGRNRLIKDWTEVVRPVRDYETERRFIDDSKRADKQLDIRGGGLAQNLDYFRGAGREQLAQDLLRKQGTMDILAPLIDKSIGLDRYSIDTVRGLGSQALGNQLAMSNSFLKAAQEMNKPTGLEWAQTLGGLGVSLAALFA